MSEASWLNRIRGILTGSQLPASVTLLHTLEGATGAIAWSPDGQMLATECPDGVQLWESTTGALLHTLGYGYHDCFAWSPDGRVLATGHDGLQLWDPTTGTLLRKFIRDDSRKRPINSVNWSPNGMLVASGSDDGKVQLWDPSTGALLHTLEREYPGRFREYLSWSPDSKILAYSTFGSEVPLWDPTTGTLLRTLSPPRTEDTYNHVILAWSPDGRLMTINTDNKVRLWNPTTGTLVRTLNKDHAESVRSVAWLRSAAWSPDGKMLGIGNFGGVQVWDSTTGELLYTLKCKNGAYSIAWSTDGRLLAADISPVIGNPHNSRISIWRTDTWEVLAVSAWLKHCVPIAWHPHLPLLVATGPQGLELSVWHLDWAGLLQTAPSLGKVSDTSTKGLVNTSNISKQTAPSRDDHEDAIAVLQYKISTQDFDVFLCHNAQDKPAVKQIGEQLKLYGILPWLDEWELRPGLPWQQLLEERIAQIKTAAVFVGKNGWGPWHRQELNAFLREFVRRGCPVIPVLLPDAPQEPPLPEFLKAMTWVDFRIQDPDPMRQLLWGITGEPRGRF